MSGRVKGLVPFFIVLAATFAAFSLYLVQLYRLHSSLRPTRASTRSELSGAPGAYGPRLRPVSVASKVEEMRRTVASERARFYLPGELDRFAFGQKLLEAAAAAGLETDRLGTPRAVAGGEDEGSSVELSVAGTPEGFLRFVESVELHEKYWAIESCSLHLLPTGVAADLVVGYREYDPPTR